MGGEKIKRSVADIIASKQSGNPVKNRKTYSTGETRSTGVDEQSMLLRLGVYIVRTLFRYKWMQSSIHCKTLNILLFLFFYSIDNENHQCLKIA